MPRYRNEPTSPMPSPIHLWCVHCETWKLPEEFYECGSWCIQCRRNASKARAQRVRDARPPKPPKPQPTADTADTANGGEPKPKRGRPRSAPASTTSPITQMAQEEVEYYRQMFPEDDWD